MNTRIVVCVPCRLHCIPGIYKCMCTKLLHNENVVSVSSFTYVKLWNVF